MRGERHIEPVQVCGVAEPTSQLDVPSVQKSIKWLIALLGNEHAETVVG
jgi:hypothetical protein